LKCLLTFYLFILIYSGSVLSQTNSPRIFHPLSNAFGITVEAGGTIPVSDYKFEELNVTSRLLLEYFFPSRSFSAFGIRLFVSGGFIKGEFFSNEIVYPPVSDNFKTGFLSLGGGFVYSMRLGKNVPYISASLGYITFNPEDKYGLNLPNNKFSVYKKEALQYLFEAGIRFPFSDRWSLNLGANINFSNTDYLDDVKAGNNNDAVITCFTGISFYLGKNVDEDNDGIGDEIDLCPDTPEGAQVDEFGCSIKVSSDDVTEYDTLKDTFISNGIFTDKNIFCFQIDVLSDSKEAETLQRKIISLGYKAFIIEMDLGGKIWYSVRIGYFNSFEVAKFYRNDFFRKTNFKIR
jgi:hypothetical protein